MNSTAKDVCSNERIELVADVVLLCSDDQAKVEEKNKQIIVDY